MNFIKSFLFIFAVALIAAGCNKKLDVAPQQNIDPNDIKTSDDVKAVLFGAYSKLQDADAFGESFFLTADLLAAQDQIYFSGSFVDYVDLNDKIQIETNLTAWNIWQNAYIIINIANIALDKIELVDEDERDAVAAEAKFIRGLAYFELVNYFAKPWSAGNTNANPAVPLMIKPVYEYNAAEHLLPRASVSAIYTQVINDLTDAAEGLPQASVNARASSFAARAILSRVYLSQGNLAGAAEEASAVIESGDYELPSTYVGSFNNVVNSSEDIFAIQQTSQSNAGTANVGLITFYMANFSDDEPSISGGRGDVKVDPSHLDIYEMEDTRGSFYYNGYSITGTAGLHTRKWSSFYRVIPVVRLAEMYLTRAEANYRKGGAPIGGVDPLDDLNTVRSRAKASLLTSIDDEGIFVEERFRELAFEGDRLWTLKRLKLDVDGLPYDDNKLVLPIPRSELDVNSKLTQNPGY